MTRSPPLPAPPRPDSPPPSNARRHPLLWLWAAAAAAAILLSLRVDLKHLEWVDRLAQDGSPPPAQDVDSPTGYTQGQRHFLGSQERGSTYRWIAATQEALFSGPLLDSTYTADTAPLGRPQMMPRLYLAWLAALSWCLHLIEGGPLGSSVETAALWEPVVCHAVALLALTLFVWRRWGGAAGAAAGIAAALYPPFAAQFAPGALNAERWALLFAGYAIARALFPRYERGSSQAFSFASAAACSASLWLSPAFGFPAALIVAAAGGAAHRQPRTPMPCLRWAATGAAITLAAAFVDTVPWSLEASELRYVHPIYAAAWLGLGLGLRAWGDWRAGEAFGRRAKICLLLAAPLTAALPYAQLRYGYLGWLYSGPSLRRIAPLDDAISSRSVLDWLAGSSAVEIILIGLPMLAAVAALALSWRLVRFSGRASAASLAPATIAYALILILTFFLIRWGVVASLLAIPLVWNVLARAKGLQWQLAAGFGLAYLIGLLAWSQMLPPSLQRPSAGLGARPKDLEALLYRHFSHWMATHAPTRPVTALAPPELSDSLIFHGGCRTLLSTAWASYSGHIAASRVLSAPEGTEAEAVLESREVTHLILPSWDPTLPVLARPNLNDERATLYESLQRWILPLFLRPTPYLMPPMPAFAAEKLAVFEVTAPQDEALALSRLAEYFVEMQRPEPAQLLAETLQKAYREDPNATIARAFVHASAKRSSAFRAELDRLAAAVDSGLAPRDRDRRILRAIVLALGGRHELARPELQSCLDTMDADTLYALTPLQIYQLIRLMERYDLVFPRSDLATLALARCSEYVAN